MNIRIFLAVVLCMHVMSCSVSPGSLRKLKAAGVTPTSADATISLPDQQGRKAEFTYLGCGGVLINKGGDALLIDPFFSNQKTGKIGKSMLLGKDGKELFHTDEKMLQAGLSAIQKDHNSKIHAILNAHSHYDHLMDVPALYARLGKKPQLLVTRSGFNVIHRTVEKTDVKIIEDFSSTPEQPSDPYRIKREKGEIRIFPILSEHNPQFRNIKFFSGEQITPVDDLSGPYARTKANLWLEGNTFSFLIDYVDDAGSIELRVFIQSSSCNSPAGVPPEQLRKHPVDVAFIGVASYQFSPGYPCELLSALNPRQVVWIHWEDFFRKYTRNPKTLRGTDVAGFFEIPCVAAIKNSGKMLWPRTKVALVY
jgi:hypothetical protein